MSKSTAEQMRKDFSIIESNENYIDDTEIKNSLKILKIDPKIQALNNDIEDLPEKSEQEIMLEIVRDLFNKYKSLRKGIRSSEGNIQTKKELTDWLDENIENLKNIRKDLGGDNESLKNKDLPITIKENAYKYSDLTVYKARIGELIYYYEHYEQVRQIITLGGKAADIHAIIDSEQDEKRAKYYEKKQK